MFRHIQGFAFTFVMLLALVVPRISLATWCVNGAIWTGTGQPTSAAGSVSWTSGSTCSTTGGLSSWGVSNPFGLPEGSIFGIVSAIVNWLLALFGILGILGFIISGIMYLVSAGNDKMAEKAKAGLVYSIIGIIVGLSGFIIMQAINGLLSGMGGQY